MVQVAEVPPGPPVLATIVAEIYGPTTTMRQKPIARQIQAILKKTRRRGGCRLLHAKRRMPEYRFTVDQEKAALTGIDAAQVTQTLAMALHG